MFYNISNHPMETWQENQIIAAGGRDNIVDIPFPFVNGSHTCSEIYKTLTEFVQKYKFTKEDTVYVVGEYTVIFALIDYLLSKGIRVVFARADLKIENYTENGKKIRSSKYNFVEFKEYKKIIVDKSPAKARNKLFINASARYRMTDADTTMLEKAKEIGEIVEYPIEPIFEQDEEGFRLAVMRHVDYIEDINPNGVILDGEFNTFFTMADILLYKGYDVYVKCANRTAEEFIDENGAACKITKFEFIQFRKLFRLENYLD